MATKKNADPEPEAVEAPVPEPVADVTPEPIPVMAFPAWRYHTDFPQGRIVQSQAEADALGEGWVKSPADLPKE